MLFKHPILRRAPLAHLPLEAWFGCVERLYVLRGIDCLHEAFPIRLDRGAVSHGRFVMRSPSYKYNRKLLYAKIVFKGLVIVRKML